jgi:nucleoside-diphosphate kinase
MERTLIILKPDALEQERLHFHVIAEIRALGLKLGPFVVRKELSSEEVRALYAAYVDAEFFPRILAYMTRGPVAIAVWEGEDAVAKMRKLAGATRPDQADPASLRARYGRITEDGDIENVLHCSASPEEAEEEIARFFGPARPA